MIQWLFILFKKFGNVRASQVARVSILFVLLLSYSSSGYYFFEKGANPDLTWADSIWWSIVTMTTVGYGDMFPVTMAGRFLVGFPTMLLGVSILGYVLSVLATAMIESRMKELKGMKKIEQTGHIVICNYVSLEQTTKLIQEIHSDSSTKDVHIVVIDNTLEELPAEMQSDAIHFVKGSPMREPVLQLASVSESKAIIIQADASRPEESDNENLRTALTLQSSAPDRFVCAECINPENKIFFERANCNSVVCIASLSTQMVVQELQDPGVSEVIEDLTSNTVGKQIYVISVSAEYSSFKALKEHYCKENATVIGLRRGKEILLIPDDAEPIKSDDQLILIAASRPV